MNEVNMDVPIDKMFGSYIFFIWIFFLIIECIILKVSFSRECGINFQKERVQQMQKSVQLYREHSTTVMNVPLFVVLTFYSSTNAKWNGKGTRERQKKNQSSFYFNTLNIWRSTDTSASLLHSLLIVIISHYLPYTYTSFVCNIVEICLYYLLLCIEPNKSIEYEIDDVKTLFMRL